MKIVRKVIRIFFVVCLISICLLSCYLLYTELKRNATYGRVNTDPGLFILIFSALLSLLSLFFNLEKLAENQRKTNIYKITRIGDFLFSLYFFALGLLAFYSLIGMVNRTFDRGEDMSMSDVALPLGVILLMLLLSVLLVIDNFKFHKSFKIMPQEESIEDIGK